MTMLTKIGNSQGIRIPKPLIEQAHLKDVDLELEVLENGLLIKPVRKHSREGWKANIEEVIAKNADLEDEAFLEEFLNDDDLEEWQW